MNKTTSEKFNAFCQAQNLDTIKRANRLIAAISDGLTDAPAEVLAEVMPRLQALAVEWGLSEIVERCQTCWRPWDECLEHEHPGDYADHLVDCDYCAEQGQ